MPEISAAALNNLNRNINSLHQAQLAMGNQVGRMAEAQQATRNTVDALEALLQEFIQRDVRDKAMAEARDGKVDVRMRLDKEFGHYEQLRRMATGIVEAVDRGLVTDATIQSLTENVMTTTPGYWLAPALVGLAAWLRDDKAVAESAVRSALERDGDKTSLFYAFVLRRFGRTAAAAHWVRRYVERQDPAKLPREFVVILDAVATGALGMECRPVVMETVAAWYEQLSADKSVVAAQIERWRRLIDGMHTPVDPRITVLPKRCGEWSQLKALYEGATVHAHAERFFRALLDAPTAPSADLRERIDKIMTNLVTDFDAAEAPLHREFDGHQAVLDHDGDRAAARTAAEAALSAREDTVDYLTLLTNAAFFPGTSGTSAATQQLAVALARDWIVAADVRLAEANRAARPEHATITVAGWHGDLAAGVPLARMENSLAAAVAKQTRALVAKVKPGPAAGFGWTGGGLFLLIAVITAVHGAFGPMVVMLLISGGCAIVAVRELGKLPARREEIERKGRERTADAVQVLRRAAAEYTDLMTAWQAEDEKAAPFTDYLGELNLASFVTRSPDQIREVL